MKRSLTAIFCVLAFSGTAQAETWTIRADNWCPYNCEPQSANPGYMIEILEQTAKASGNTLDYKHLPWSRALDDARNGTITGVVGVTDGDRTGLVLSEKMGVDDGCFFVSEGSTFKYTGPKDLAKLGSVGVTQDYVYSDEFTEWRKTNEGKIQSVVGNNTIETNAKKVKAGRIQAFLENSNVVGHARKTIPELKGVVSSGCLSSSPLYIGISAKNPKATEITKLVNARVADMKKSGELKKILDKYGMSAW